MRRGWLTPESLPSTTKSCVITFPDNEEFESLIRGCLLLLALEENWEKFGSLSVQDTADSFREVLINFLNQDCEPMPPIGSIIAYGGATEPAGWIFCCGQEILRADYESLYDVIALRYGGASSGYFRVPDLRGRWPAGLDTGQSEFNNLGVMGGTKTHTLTTAEMPAHLHGVTVNYRAAGSVTPAAGTFAVPTTSSTVGFDRAMSTSNQGSGGAHNNLSPFTVINYIIRYR